VAVGSSLKDLAKKDQGSREVSTSSGSPRGGLLATDRNVEPARDKAELCRRVEAGHTQERAIGRSRSSARAPKSNYKQSYELASAGGLQGQLRNGLGLMSPYPLQDRDRSRTSLRAGIKLRSGIS
jgi:hypothetical protein